MSTLRLQRSDYRTLPLPDSKIQAERDKMLEEAKAKEEAERKQVQYQQRLAAANIPKRLMQVATECKFDQQSAWGKAYLQFIPKLGAGFLVSLLGGYGTGKSQMGAAVAHTAIAREYTALFVHAPDLMDTIKDVYRADDGSTVRKAMTRFTDPDLLVIDEVNQGLSEADIRYLHRVVCQRYDDMSDTLLISNESKANYQKLVGDRVVSRMIEVGGIIEASWPSFRRAKS